MTTYAEQALIIYNEGLEKVQSTPQPLGQKFPIGSRVRIADEIIPYMNNSKNGCEATVLYTYAHAYWGNDVKSYALDIDGQGNSAWYQEEQLSLIK